MAKRDGALKGGAWVLVVATLAGFGVLAQRVFFKAKSELEEAKSQPAPAVVTAPLTSDARVRACREAFDAASTRGWSGAVSACEEATRYVPEAQRPDGPPAEASIGVRSLARHARTQLECERSLNKALRFIDGGRVEEAGFALAAVAPECATKQQADELAASLKSELIRVAAAQCEKRAQEGRWSGIFDACERYVELKYCPGDLKELVVPKGKFLDLDGSASGKRKGRGWRPEDPLLVHFLAAKKASHSARGPWRCTTHFEPVKPPPFVPPIIRGTGPLPEEP